MARREVEPKTALGGRLRSIRREMGDPQRAHFAERLGISEKTLASYERGETKPDTDGLAAYQQAFGINANWIVSGAGPMFEDQSKAPGRPASVLSDWLMNELGKIVVREHRSAGISLRPEAVAPEAGALYNEILGMVKDVSDQRTVAVVLPLLAENLRERLRSASAEPGAGKREAS